MFLTPPHHSSGGGGGGTLKVLTHLVIFFQVKGAIGESIIGQGVNIEITQR